MLEEYQKALEDAVRSIALDEGFVKGYLRAAKCHQMLGNPSLSVDYYRKVFERAPGNSQAKMKVSVCVCVCVCVCCVCMCVLCVCVCVVTSSVKGRLPHSHTPIEF